MPGLDQQMLAMMKCSMTLQESQPSGSRPSMRIPRPHNGATLVYGFCLDLFLAGGKNFVHLD